MEILSAKIRIVYYNLRKMAEIFVIRDLGACKTNELLRGY